MRPSGLSVSRGQKRVRSVTLAVLFVYTEELVARVKRKALGIEVGNGKISLLLNADDIIMFSENREDIQVWLNAVHEYNTLFDVNISVEKNKFMVLNKNWEKINLTSGDWVM